MRGDAWRLLHETVGPRDEEASDRMSKPGSLSAFVQRCQDALAEYSRLMALGVSHDMAIKPLQEAMRPQEKTGYDSKLRQAGEQD
jgi:hypothetical protein